MTPPVPPPAAVPPPGPSGPGGFDAVAWSWVQHLRHGGTRPWLEWVATAGEARAADDLAVGADAAAAAVDAGAGLRAGRPPGAAQLEAVRRLAARLAAGSAAPVPFEELADLVLGRAAPGRGPDDLPLVWPGDDRKAGFGPPPVDPCELPAEELVRVLVGVIAELLVRTGAARTGAGGRSGRSGRPGRRDRADLRDRAAGFPVLGSPAPAAWVRSALAAAGHQPVERPTAAVVLAEPVDRMLAQTWTRRVRRGAVVAWPKYVERWSRLGRLPASVDLEAVTARWAEQVGPDRVHVVPLARDQQDLAAARSVAGHVLGLSLAAPTGGAAPVGAGAEPPATGPAAPARLGADQVELVRLVNQVLRGRVPDERHRQLLRRLVPRVAGSVARSDTGSPLLLPARHAGWAAETTDRLRERLAGYQVHGDLDALAVGPAAVSTPEDEDLLSLALDTCLLLAADPATSVVLSPASSGAGR